MFHRRRGMKPRYRKYRNHKYYFHGHKFDSKAELQFYFLLLGEHANFRCHPRYEIIPHTDYSHAGNDFHVNKHNYTPDFVLFNSNGKIQSVIDIKGMNNGSAYSHLRMDLFSLRYQVPVTIVRKKHGRFYKKIRNT